MTASVPPSTGKKSIGLAKLPASITTTEPRKRHHDNDPVSYVASTNNGPQAKNRNLFKSVQPKPGSERALSMESGPGFTNINISRH